MNTKLDHITDWPQLAKQTGWSVKGMADYCNVSVRSLQRHFVKTMGKTPIAWVNEHRQKHASELLQKSNSIKETSAELGYKHGTHFTRDFKKHWGSCPTQFNPNSQIKPANPRQTPPAP